MLKLLKNKIKGPLFICQISDTQVKVIKCALRGDQREFIALETEELDFGIDDKALIEKLGKVLKKLGFSGNPVVVCLPRSKVTCRFLKVPTHVPKEIEEIVNLQASRFLPYPPEELITGYQSISTDKDGYSELNIVIMHRDVAERYINIFRELRSSNITIALSSYGLVNFYENARPLDTEPVMIIDVDSPIVELAAVNNKKLIFSRYFRLDKSQSNWEALFIEEINKSRDLYVRDTSKEGFKKGVVILGGKSSQEVALALKKQQGFISETVSYEKISLSEDLKKKIALSESSFASMIGLGLKSVDISLNLLTVEAKSQVKVLVKRNEWLRTGAFIAAILVVSGLAMAKALDNKEVYLKQIKSELVKIKKDAVSLEEIEKKFKLMEKSLKKQPSALSVLYEMHKLIPPGISLVSLGYEEDKEVVLRGQTSDLASVFSLASALNDNPVFKKFNVKVRYATKSRTARSEIINFEIACIQG